jgi:hypothetical protein
MPCAALVYKKLRFETLGAVWATIDRYRIDGARCGGSKLTDKQHLEAMLTANTQLASGVADF